MQKRGQSILGAKQASDSNPIPPDGINRPELGREGGGARRYSVKKAGGCLSGLRQLGK